MPPIFYSQGRKKEREPVRPSRCHPATAGIDKGTFPQEPIVRKFILEGLLVLASSRQIRDHMRSINLYPVLKVLHVALERPETALEQSKENETEQMPSEPAESKDEAGTMVVPDDSEEPDFGLSPEDEATVQSIIKLVRLLFHSYPRWYVSN